MTVAHLTPALPSIDRDREIQGRDFRQYRRPFEIPDSATVAGTTFTGCRARAYHLLRITAERQALHPIGPWSGPPGWVPVFLLVEPWSGGSEGTRRVRELRERYGCSIEIADFDPPDGSESTTKIYRLCPGAAPAAATAIAAPIAATSSARPHPPGATPHLQGAPGRGTRAAAIGASERDRSTPLAGVAFATRLLPPGDGRETAKVEQRPSGPIFSIAFRCDPGLTHPLAPSVVIADRAQTGTPLEEIDELYRAELRERYSCGALERALLGHRAVWIQATDLGLGWTALRVLPDVLEALGATRLDDERSATEEKLRC